MTEASTELTAELLVDGAMPVDPVISPDGRRLAWAVRAPDGAQHRLSTLWVAPADTSAPPRRLTPGAAPRWAPDSASLLFIADHQLCRIRPDGGDAETLTSWRSGIVSHLPLAGDTLARGAVAAVIAPDEPTEQDERKAAEGDDARIWGQDTPPHRLWLFDPGRPGLALMDGLGERHVTEVVQRPDAPSPISASSTSSSSTRARATRSWNARTRSTCSTAPAPGSPAGSATRPVTGD